MAEGYNPAKAAEFNKLILQGIEYEEALILAEIPLGEVGNYSFDPKTSILSQQEGPPETQPPVNPANDPNSNIGADTTQLERLGNVDAASDPNTNVGADTPREIPVSESVFDPRQDVGENVFDPAAALPNPSLISAAPINDPYAGLTSDQIRLLGGADPTDPYIRARLGIPQLTDSPLAANASFGTIKTGVPILDTAISSLGNLFGFNNTKTGTKTGSPAPTPDTAAIAQDAAKLRAQDPALTDDEDQNLQNVVGAQGEIVRAEENIQSNNRQISANEESQAAAQEQQRQAQAIIDQNNAELADDTLPDSRRAELEANNAAQRASIAENAAVIDEAQTNIDNATANNEQQTDSILTNQGVIAENAEAFTANGNELGALVVADDDDPAIAPPVDQNFIDANAEPQDVDPVDDPALEEPVEDIFVEADETVTELTEEETAALFDGTEPVEDIFVEVDETVTENVDPADDPALEEPVEDIFVEVDETVTELTEEQTAALFDGTETELIVTDITDLAEPVDPDADPELLGDPELQDGEITDLAEPVDPDADPELVELGDPDLQLTDLAEPVNPDADPELVELGDPDLQLTDLAEPVDPDADPELEELGDPNLQDGEITELAEPVDPDADPAPELLGGPQDDEELEQLSGPTDVDAESDQGLPQSDGTEGGIQDQINNQDAAAEAAARDSAKNQATLQARYKQPASSDWRVRLQLAPNADYLYKDRTGSTILAPLYETDGVIFPYTPQIETSYNANYEMYDLTHSNFRGYFYKNSRVNDINIRATFTAQDTQEANYLLAVIHFFRSVTKMFYGAKDALRGAPPPLTYLSGLGQYQFNQHPCVVSQFNYSLPNDVDYIRAGAPNNYGTNLLTQRARTGAIAPEAGNPSLARLFGTQTKPQQGADPTPPSPSMINQNVNNLAQATYVPTKIEISLTLLPINTRSQVSTQFNMKEFASGALIKGGFW